MPGPFYHRPLPPKVEGGLSERRILQETDPARFDRSEKARITEYKEGISKRDNAPKVGARIRTEAYIRYSCTITFMPNDKLIVSCTCPDFLNVHEYALWINGGAYMRFGNGEPPVQKNPAMSASMCKHLLALYEKGKAARNRLEKTVIEDRPDSAPKIKKEKNGPDQPV